MEIDSSQRPFFHLGCDLTSLCIVLPFVINARGEFGWTEKFTVYGDFEVFRDKDTLLHKKRRTLAAAAASALGAARSMLKVFDIHPNNQPARELSLPAGYGVRLPAASVSRTEMASGPVRGGFSNSTFVVASNVCLLLPQSARAFFSPRTDCARLTVTPRRLRDRLHQFSPSVRSLVRALASRRARLFGLRSHRSSGAELKKQANTRSQRLEPREDL